MNCDDANRSRRRWLQFSLRGLFVLTLVVALGLGWIASERRKVWLEDRAVEEIELANGRAFRDISDDTYWDCEWPRDWAAWKMKIFGENVGMPVEWVGVGPRSELQALDELKCMRALRRVNLEGAQFGGEHVGLLLECREIEELDLSATDITDAGAVRLASLPKLKELRLDHTAITGRTLEAFRDVDLERLLIRDTAVSFEAAKAYQKAHARWWLEDCYAPSPSAGHREAAVKLIRQGASVWTGLQTGNWSERWDGALKDVITTVQFGSSWDGSLEDLEILKELQGLSRIDLDYTGLDEDVLRWLCETALAEALVVEHSEGEPKGHGAMSPLARASFHYLSLELVEGQSLDFLAEMKSLEELSLNGDLFAKPVLTGSSLAVLRDCEVLESLWLHHVGIAEGFFPLLAECPHLQKLALHYCWMSDGGMRGLSGLTGLRRLSIYRVKDFDFEDIDELSQLEDLSLGFMRLSDSQFETLSRLEHLKRLSLWRMDVSDENLKQVASLRELEVLKIVAPNIARRGRQAGGLSPVGLEYLRQLPELREVEIRLRASDVDPEIVAEFEEEIAARAQQSAALAD